MGKSVSGAIWLNGDKLSSYDYWQFWRNTEDADVGRFLRLFTELPLAEIVKLDKLEGAELNDAKIILATEACALCHGRMEAEKACKAAADTFVKATTSEDSEDLPTILISKKHLTNAAYQRMKLHAGGEELRKHVGLLEILQRFGFTKSNSEGRRFIEQGGVKINDETITDPLYQLTDEDIRSYTAFVKDQNGKILSGGPVKTSYIKISLGKKKHGLIHISE